MRIWIDMDNSPHVPLLVPFIRSLERQGCSWLVTCRDYAQTVDLMKATGLPFKLLGKHGGANKIKKVFSTIARTIDLVRFAKGKQILLAINHGSRSQTLACKLLGIPCFVGMDYEHTESTIFSKFASYIWMPELLYPKALPIIGIPKERALVYKGIKEQFYLENFVPDPSFKKDHSIPEDKILVILRPPAEMANYHHPKSESLLNKMIEKIKQNDNTYTLCFPRTKDQGRKLSSHASNNFVVCDKVLDGKNVAFYADVMISGGGTMNREAAYFGAAVFSIFSGPKPMIDSSLATMGLLTFIESDDQIEAIEFRGKSRTATKLSSQPDTVINQLIDQFITLTSRHHERRIRRPEAELLIDQE